MHVPNDCLRRRRAPRTLRFGATLLAAAGVLPTSGNAQTQPSVPLMPEVLVEAQRLINSLTVPTAEQARQEMNRIPGNVGFVRKDDYAATPGLTLKDMLDYTPGVFAQPKWGEDTRLSIRGSGLSRNFHLRGVSLFQDGIPLNTSDGAGDFQETDPSAFRYVEIYKGANGLRYGASTLGGAVNFVTTTGRDANLATLRVDAGSFNFWRTVLSSGTQFGDLDYFITASATSQDGYRDHSDARALRARANVGWRITPDVETRFYVDLNRIRQEIPGAVSRTAALTVPTAAAPGNLLGHYQRNIDSVRVANRTVVTLDETTIEFGAFAIHKHLMHPIFQYLDYFYNDVGGFGRITDERKLFGHDNRFTFGINLYGGTANAARYVNLAGNKGNLTFKSADDAMNMVVYGENAFYMVPDVAVVVGAQYIYSTRERRDQFLADGNQSGTNTYRLFTPKVGVLWNVRPYWQVFANLSRGAEVPTFGEINYATVPLSQLKASTATTIEIGTRGRTENYTWDIAFYRSWIKNEFLFFDLGGGNYQVVNADRTIHQGVEVGFGAAIWHGLLDIGTNPDKLWINVAYTFSDFRFDGDKAWGDNKLPGAPNHYLRGEILYKHPSGFFAGPNLEWVPEAFYVDNANSLKTAAYALLGFKIGYDDAKRWSVFFEARNLTDKKYIASASTAAKAAINQALFEPGTGRAFYAGVQMRW